MLLLGLLVNVINVNKLRAHIDELGMGLVSISTSIHAGDVQKLIVATAGVDDKLRTKGAFGIVGDKRVILATMERTDLLRWKVGNDFTLLACFGVDPVDTDIVFRIQGVDEVCSAREGVDYKIRDIKGGLAAMGVTGINAHEGAEGTLLVVHSEEMSWV
mmetsp:Transcript_22325/g.34061  ORF Transcript_22325/g.34061 Transcript_22325/m.34061 type:complete len:159 (-) Transcript_22325:945-1421(-)